MHLQVCRDRSNDASSCRSCCQLGRCTPSDTLPGALDPGLSDQYGDENADKDRNTELCRRAASGPSSRRSPRALRLNTSQMSSQGRWVEVTPQVGQHLEGLAFQVALQTGGDVRKGAAARLYDLPSPAQHSTVVCVNTL